VEERSGGAWGYEGETDTITVAFKKPKGGQLTDVQQTHNKAHNGIRAIGERGNSLLKTTFKALRNVSLCPEDRQDCQSRTRPPACRIRPNHVITQRHEALRGKAQ